MNEQKPAVNTTPAAAPEKVETSTTTIEDIETKVLALEADKARLIEEAANWKVAALKYKSKTEVDPDETEEEKIRRVTHEELSKKEIAHIEAQKDQLLKQLAKENKELKLANLNKTVIPPQSIGIHSEGQPVKDTLITQEQLLAFKAKGWTDKDIERYKKNLQKYGGR